MGYIISFTISVVSAMLVFILQHVIKENSRLKKNADEELAKRNDAIAKGVVCMLRKNLMEEHDRWVEKGFITSHALESDIAMYKAYKTLGGNGMIDHMDSEIRELQIKD